MKQQSKQKPSKITKTLVNKIHGGRKQDSKFWQSEFAETNDKTVMKETSKRKNLIEEFTFLLLFIVGIGIVAYGGFFLYKRYYAEFTSPNPSIEQAPEQKQLLSPTDRPITKSELDRAIQKALEEKSNKQQQNPIPQADKFYYRIELVNGGRIEAESATRDGDIFTIKDRKGLVITVNRTEINTVKKVKL